VCSRPNRLSALRIFSLEIWGSRAAGACLILLQFVVT
jgi:hypothetical protein